ncbi:MAG: DUF4147 domain-containing protein [Thermoplasmatota archaeon]
MARVQDRKEIVKALERSLIRVSPSILVRSACTLENEGIKIRGIPSGDWTPEDMIPSGAKLFVAAVGKGALKMAQGLVEALEGTGIEILEGSMVISNRQVVDTELPHAFQYFVGNHPFPGREDVSNTNTLLGRLSSLDKGTTVLFLLSGGASSLLFRPRDRLTPDVYIDIVRAVMLGGGSIRELNTVRTFMSDVKGGGLCRPLEGRRVISLVLSDVMGDDPRFIGSGPTFPWEPDPAEVSSIMGRYGIGKEVVSTVRSAGPRAPLPMMNLTNLLIGSNDAFLDALTSELTDTGWEVKAERRKFQGDARETGLELLQAGREALDSTGCSAFLQGGETTVSVKGPGKGGRNSEMASSLIPLLKEGETVICLATDGKDGSWEGAGMIVDINTSRRGLRRALMTNDTGSYAERSGSAVITGPTGNNLGDVFILLRSPPRGPRLHRM